MLGVVMADEYRPELREVPDPSPGDGEVLIRVACAGICGSDLAKFRGDLRGVPGRIPGHEFSGTVVEVGSGVERLRVGDRVAVDPTMSCGSCRFCRSGRPHLCDDYRAVGRHIDGGYAEYCAVPAIQALPLPDRVSFEQGALVEPVACCLHGLELMRFRPGSSAAVVGAGSIGLLFTQLLRLAGARSVVVVEPNQARRELALTLGATAAVEPGRVTAGAGDWADYVVEAVGNPATVEAAIDLCARGGTVLLFGVGRADHVARLPIFRVYHEEITIAGSFLNPFKSQEALDLLAAGGLRVEPLLTRFAMADFHQAVARAMAGECVKAVLVPNGEGRS